MLKVFQSILERFKMLKESEIINVVKNYDGLYDVTLDKPSNDYDHYFVNWKDVPRYDNDGKLIPPEVFKEKIIDSFGEVHFAQNYECSFIGSSHTLIDPEVLKDFSSIEPLYQRDGFLNVFEEPIKNHKYILAVDPAKTGLDAFASHILDITTFPFKQVCAAQIYKCNWQIMPEYVNEWGISYNNAFIIIENNEGAGTFIAEMLRTEFEYDNLFFERKTNQNNPNGKKVKEAGFRTTTKSRKLILDTLKLFMNNKQLIINDKNTITEFYTFINKNGKYQADDGCHDDMIMSLALAFAPFCNSHNFEDFRELIKQIYSSNSEDAVSKNSSITDYMVIGSFDDANDQNYKNPDYQSSTMHDFF